MFDDLVTDPERPASMIAWEEDQARAEFFAESLQAALDGSGPRHAGLAQLRSEITGQYIAEGAQS
jgi:hypothetical protein